MNKPLFSIIIPLYNKEKYIKRAINSIFQQNVENFEVIIVNDGSTDNSLSVCKTFLDNRIKIFNRKHEGVSCTRNYGIKKAKGKYIIFLDADDKWNNNFLKEIIYLQKKYPKINIFATGFETIYSNKKEIRNLPYKRNNFVIKNILKLIAKNNFFLHISSVVIDRKVFDDIGMFSPHKPIDKKEIIMFEDFDIYLRIFEKYKLAYTQEILCAYYKNNKDNITLQKNINVSIKYKFFRDTLVKKFDKSSFIEKKYIKEIMSKMYLQLMSIYLVRKQYKNIFALEKEIKNCEFNIISLLNKFK